MILFLPLILGGGGGNSGGGSEAAPALTGQVGHAAGAALRTRMYTSLSRLRRRCPRRPWPAFLLSRSLAAPLPDSFRGGGGGDGSCEDCDCSRNFEMEPTGLPDRPTD